MNRNTIISVAASTVFLTVMLLSHSCANTTQAPTGGPKDTIPPVLLSVSPTVCQTLVDTHKAVFYFTFDEYVAIKDAKAITISPPQSKMPKTSLVKKSLRIACEEGLLPDVTYTVDISGAVGDNNEGNMFPGYVLVFSTGERIDSMYITGTVQDCATLNPIKGATVMLYKDLGDSAVFKALPDVTGKTDDWGFFCLRNIQDTVFRLYAIVDENSNNRFDPETEKIAFCDSVVRPAHKVGRDIYELYKFDMKDTAACLRRHSDYELNLFKGGNSKQALMNKARTGERSAYITFMAPYVNITQLWFKGVPKQNIIRQFNDNRDSLLLWVNDQRKQPDTLHLNVEYMKTDSTGALVKTLEKLKLARERKDMVAAKKSSKRNLKHEDTIAVFKAESEGERFEQYGIRLVFDNPLIQESFDSLEYSIFNPKQQKSKGKYKWMRDTSDVRAYYVQNVGKILPGYEYIFKIPHRKFQDVNGYYNDSLEVKVKLPDDDKLSTLSLNMHNVKSNFIVDLMTEKRDNVLRSFKFSSDCTLTFPYLKEGRYCIRIVNDPNGNGRVDTGDLLAHRQPEKVKFYKLRDGSFLLSLLPSSELTQDIDVASLFR